ncbi:MAG: DUF1376 domain-containing protein, partial [Pseudomonadota bacterium]
MTKPGKKEYPLTKYLQGTELLSHDELGIYIRLLEYMWITKGKISNNDEKIAYYLRITQKKWQNYKKVLQGFFVFSKTNMSHVMMQAEYERFAHKSKQNALNARKRWGVNPRNTQDK